jgi:hypothetical protein
LISLGLCTGWKIKRSELQGRKLHGLVEGNVYKLARRAKELSGLIKSSCRSFAFYTEDGDKKERMFGLLIENEMRMKVCPCNETPGDYSYHLIRSKTKVFYVKAHH